jgi:CubicO group peptidase (beta-lactamase class C family)
MLNRKNSAPTRLISSAAALVLLLASIARAAEPAPSFQWQTAAPESQGMSKSKLDAIRDDLEKHSTKIFLVVRNDRIVYEWYANDFSATKPHYTASLAKGMIAGNSLAFAMQDGKISPNDLASKYVPQWASDPRKSKITIRHLGSHTSGLEDAEENRLPHDKLSGWKGDFWKQLNPPRDPFTIARDETPTFAAPGERIQYSNPGIGMMTYCVTAAIHDGAQKDVRTLLRDRLMRPIGLTESDWSVGYGKSFTVDGLPLVAT